MNVALFVFSIGSESHLDDSCDTLADEGSLNQIFSQLEQSNSGKSPPPTGSPDQLRLDRTVWMRGGALQEEEEEEGNCKSPGNKKQPLKVFCIMQRQASVCLQRHITHHEFKVRFTAWHHYSLSHSVSTSF